MPAWTRIYVQDEPKLDDPILIQGLPGLGFVGKLAVTYLIDELKLKCFAELYSSYLMLIDGSTGVQINADGAFTLPKFEFYACSKTEPHIIFLTGDTQPAVYGQYEIADEVLNFAKQLGCKKVIALGGFQTPIEDDQGKVYGVFNRQHSERQLHDLGITVTRSGAITGACGVILGLGDQRKFDAIGLLGATRGEYPDMKAAKGVLQILSQILNLKVDTTRLDKEIDEMKNKMESLYRIQTEAALQMKKEGKKGPAPFYV